MQMPDLTFDFTWYKDPKGYRLIPAKPLKGRPGQSLLDASPTDIQPARIVRKGGDLQSYRPLDHFPDLFRYFIDMTRSEKGVLEFVERFGPLTYKGLRRDGDVVFDVIKQAEDMSQALCGRPVGMPLNKLNASIVTDHNKLRLKVGPACLLDALWLQLAQTKSTTNFRECPQCHRSFITGHSRRADARFCSFECKTKFHSLERSR